MNDDCRARRERKFDNQHRLINFNLTLIIFTYNYVQHNLYTLGLKAHHLNNSGLRSCLSMFLIFFAGCHLIHSFLVCEPTGIQP